MIIRPLPITPANAEAIGYVSTTPEEGLAQLEVLKSLGCQPHHRVLEVGCGALIAGYPVMQYLDVGKYVGLDPNVWLWKASAKTDGVWHAFLDKGAEIQSSENFRFSGRERKFDFIFSHSILSHASFIQLAEFMRAAADQLMPDGVLAASLRLAEGNEYGSPGSTKHGADFAEWQYPGVSWFTREEVHEAAKKAGLSVRVTLELTDTIMRGNPKAIHDWIVVRHEAAVKDSAGNAYARAKDRLIADAEQKGVSISDHSLVLQYGGTGGHGSNLTEAQKRSLEGPKGPVFAPKVTLVTGFFRLSDRRVLEDEQFQLFQQLAETGLPFVLFLDERIGLTDFPINVHIVRTSLDTFLAYKIALGRKDWPLPEHRDSKKDTREFLILQNSKLEMIQHALSHCETSHVAWIDFGILKVAKDRAKFLERLRQLCTGPLPEKCVLAPGCWDALKTPIVNDGVHWRFCGGFLLADRASTNQLASNFIHTFIRQPRLTWEVNVWAEMERQGVKFDWYKADHDDSIIKVPEEMRHKKAEKRSLPALAPDPIALRRASRAAAKAVPKICLNMIVKNEVKVPNSDGTFRNNLERCLKSALPYIDSWVIADTGSTDGTPEFIDEFFKRHEKPGVLVKTEFKDFSQARNFALDAARSIPGWDYALLIDADMELTGTLDKSKLTHHSYTIRQHCPPLTFANVRLVNRSVTGRYLGVTHEYLDVGDNLPLESVRIVDRNDGASHPEKALRDIRLLRDGLKNEPQNVRYMFYLANVLREIGCHHEAILWYKKRIAGGGWDEEIWASKYGIARCLLELDEALGRSPAEFVYACLEAYEFRPFRAEPLMLLSQFFRDRGRNELGATYAELASRLPMTGDNLFVEYEAYGVKAEENLSICGYYSQVAYRRELARHAAARVTFTPTDWHRLGARLNWAKFYTKTADELFGAEMRDIGFQPPDGWHPCNPSVLVTRDSRRLVLVRTVNYTVSDGQYPTIDNSGVIRTNNWLLEFDESWNKKSANVIAGAGSGHGADPNGYVTGKRSGFAVEGFEDCRLWQDVNGDLMISATVRDLEDNKDGKCEMVVARLKDDKFVLDMKPIRNRTATEKNWMPILGKCGAFVYLTDPTTVVDVEYSDLSSPPNEIKGYDESATDTIAPKPAPVCLRDLRGGSQVIPFDDGWLCLTHEVAWEDRQRYYLHRFVWFDANFVVHKITEPFFFKHKGIEFCAGLAHDNGKLVASFGVNDASAWLAFFDPERVRKELRGLP